MPQAAQHWMQILAWLCLGNILYVGWVAMRQKRPEPAHRQFERGAHGLHFPRHREPEPHRRDRRGGHHDRARIPRGADVRLERLHLPADRHAGDERTRRAGAQTAVHRHGAVDGGAGRLRSAGLCEFRRRSHGVLRRVEGVSAGDRPGALGRVDDRRALHAARDAERFARSAAGKMGGHFRRSARLAQTALRAAAREPAGVRLFPAFAHGKNHAGRGENCEDGDR